MAASDEVEDERERVAREVFSRATALVHLQDIAERQNDSIAQMGASIAQQNESIQALATIVTEGLKERPTRSELRSTSGLIRIVTLLIVGAMFIVLWQGQNYIRDCTQEGGKCHARSSQATTQAVQGLQLTMIITAQCTLDGANPVEPCVKAELERRADEAQKATTTVP